MLENTNGVVFYSSKETARRTGASLRQLQSWDEIGVLRAGRDPRSCARHARRVYTQAQVEKARVVAALVNGNLGISPRRAFPLADLLTEKVELSSLSFDPKTFSIDIVSGCLVNIYSNGALYASSFVKEPAV